MEDKFKMYDDTNMEDAKEIEEEYETEEEVNEEEVEIDDEETEATEENIIEEEETKTTKEKFQEKVNKEVPNKPMHQTDDKSKLVIMVMAIAVLLIAIVSVIVAPLFKKEEEKPPIVTEKPELKSEYTLEGNQLQEFDLSFLKLENEESNKIYSPLSIKYALEMLSEGTEDTSKEQIDAILGDYKPIKYENNQNMSFANAMYIRQTYKTQVKDEYTKALMDKYYADVIFDSFENATNINSWVSNRTFGLVDNLLTDVQVSESDFFLINALAINMEWNKKLQAAELNEESFAVDYKHEDYSHYISSLAGSGYEYIKFNNDKEVETLKIGASINNYDIVTALGEENIRSTITKEYDEFLKNGGCGENDLDTKTFVENFIQELDANYKKIDVSTDFEFYTNDYVKVFAKDLKTYGNTTLRYIGIMPTKELLTDYVDKTSSKEITTLINKLKKVELNNFENGVITKITGNIPTFKFDYELSLKEDLEKLDIKDVFDKEKANLDALTKDKNAYIDKAIHKANIEFSNEGIKAAAATAIGGMGAASCNFEHLYEVPVEVIDLTFDKPFMFLIQDKNTKEIWFAGTVYEPNEKQTSMN